MPMVKQLSNASDCDDKNAVNTFWTCERIIEPSAADVGGGGGGSGGWSCSSSSCSWVLWVVSEHLGDRLLFSSDNVVNADEVIRLDLVAK